MQPSKHSAQTCPSGIITLGQAYEQLLGLDVLLQPFSTVERARRNASSVPVWPEGCLFGPKDQITPDDMTWAAVQIRIALWSIFNTIKTIVDSENLDALSERVLCEGYLQGIAYCIRRGKELFSPPLLPQK